MESHALFATLRDALAALYPAEQDATIVVTDAGLNTSQVTFSSHAQTNWHNILVEAIRQNRLDAVLHVVRTTYGDNPRFQAALDGYRQLLDQGGQIEPAVPLALDSEPGSSIKMDGGAYIAGNVTADKGDVIGRDQQIAGDPIDARAAKGFINRPTAPVTQHFGNTVNLGPLKIPKPVAGILLASIVVVVILIGQMTHYTQGMFQVISAPTPTPTSTVPTATPTLTPLPTATSLAFATEAPGETLILIANFLVTEGNRNTHAHGEIHERILEEAKKVNETQLRVEIEPAVLASNQREQAEALGQQYHASMVIWGDDTGARMKVNFLNLRQPDFTVATVSIRETARTQIVNPNAYQQFVLEDLPRQLTFLTLFAVGQSYYSQQDYAQAITVTEAAIHSLQGKLESAGLADAYFRLGWLYQQPPAELDQALAAYDQAIALRPDYTAAYNNRGNVRYAQGKLNTALADYDQAIALDPNQAFPYNNRAIVHHDQGDLDAAIADYNQAITLAPDYAEAYYNRGIVRYAQGQLEAAIADYDQAIARQPDLVAAYNNRGAAHEDQGQLDIAMGDYDQAIALQPNNAEAYTNRGNVHYAQGNLEAALADYDQAIAVQPNYTNAYYNRGLAHHDQGELAAAIADYDQAIRLRPGLAAAYADRGLAHADQGEFDAAIADYDQAIQLDPDNVLPYIDRGVAHHIQGKLDEAVADYDQAISLDPNHAFVYSLRGDALAVLGKLAEAIADYRHYLQLRPGASAHRTQIEQRIAELEAEVAQQK